MAYIYQNSAWAAYDSKKYKVNTTTFTTYPFTIKSPTTPINITIYGNMLQTGTPTPTNPIQPQECGDLEATGEYTGQYKIPILSANTTTNIYLSGVQSTRKIKKLVLTGNETIEYDDRYNRFTFNINNIMQKSPARTNELVCSHYIAIYDGRSISDVPNNSIYCGTGRDVYIKTDLYITVEDFKAYLATQYAADTPVCIWYVLATEETGMVNEPLRKIGDYADTLTTSIPVTINSDSIDISTTLKPSAVAAPSLSWGTGDDYKRTSGAWE